MKLSELKRIVLDSVPADWASIPSPAGPQWVGEVSSGDQHWLEFRAHHSHYVFREDVRIGLAVGMEGFQGDRDLVFPWANWPDQSVGAYFADVIFNGRVVHREQLLVVDGGRSYLPTPMPVRGADAQTFVDTIAEDDIAYARLFSQLVGHTEFDRYLEQSKLARVRAHDEPRPSGW
jgi:hypothetical protein